MLKKEETINLRLNLSSVLKQELLWYMSLYHPAPPKLTFISCFSASCGLIWACEDIFHSTQSQESNEFYAALHINIKTQWDIW